MERMKRKYFKPGSLAWLASVTPLAAGIFMASEPLHQLSNWVATVGNLTGNVPPYILINGGLVGIGLRGAAE